MGASTPVVSICDVVRMTGTSFLGVLKIVQVTAAELAFVGDDARHVIRMMLHRSAFTLLSAWRMSSGMFLIDAKDDRLVVAVGALEIIGQMMRHRLGAGKIAR